MKLSRVPGLRAAAVRALTAVASDIDPSIPASDPLEAVEREIDLIRRDERPILAGPWISEVGFEVLYWIPFLRWLRDHLALDPERVVAVSRGGAAAWYEGVATRYVDIFDLVDPDEFRTRTIQRWDESGGQKHTTTGHWDGRLLAQVREQLGIAESHVLHPSLMYAFFRSFWLGRVRLSDAASHLVFERTAAPSNTAVDELLPKGEFVAVKFYFRPSFTDDQSNRKAASHLVESLARRIPVVLLNTGMAIDDHADFDPRVTKGVVSLAGRIPVATNLAVQSAVISRARAFVGTYGGLAYLATSYGIPAVAVASTPEEIVSAHIEIGRLAGRALAAPLVLLRPTEIDMARIMGCASNEPAPARSGERS